LFLIHFKYINFFLMRHNKRKGHRGHKTRRRRRVGALALNPNRPEIKLAAIALGYFLLADQINGAIDKVVPDSIKTATDFKKYIPGAAEAGLGALLLTSKKKPSLIKTAAGGIIAGAGLKRLLVQAGVVTGYQAVPVIGRMGRRKMAGYQSVPVIGRMPPQLSGTPAQLQGYGVNGYTPHGSGVGVMGKVGSVGSFAEKGSGVTYSNSSGYMG
jgi:hypothetical protein